MEYNDHQDGMSEGHSRELAFRRGFSHGYSRAIDILDTCREKQMSPDDTYNEMVRFLNEDVSTWREHASREPNEDEKQYGLTP